MCQHTNSWMDSTLLTTDTCKLWQSLSLQPQDSLEEKTGTVFCLSHKLVSALEPMSRPGYICLFVYKQLVPWNWAFSGDARHVTSVLGQIILQLLGGTEVQWVYFSASLSWCPEKSQSNCQKCRSGGLARCLVCCCCVIAIAEHRQLSALLGNQGLQDSVSQQLFQLWHQTHSSLKLRYFMYVQASSL